MPEMRTVCVGTKFRGPEAVEALGALAKGAPLTLRHEADNEYDPNAVAIYSGDQHLGYIPRSHNPSIAVLLRDNRPLTAELTLEAIVDKGDVKAAPRITITWGPVPDIGPNQNDGPADFSDKG